MSEEENSKNTENYLIGKNFSQTFFEHYVVIITFL